MIPGTDERVPRHTAPRYNDAIRSQTAANVAHYGALGPQAIERRLAELDQEWDIERMLEANAATAVLTSLALATTVNRKWLALTGLVGGFLLLHAAQGWCPPVPLFRRLGFRTSAEIHQERYALKALRGDFSNLPRNSLASGELTSHQALQAAEF